MWPERIELLSVWESVKNVLLILLNILSCEMVAKNDLASQLIQDTKAVQEVL